MSPRTELTSHPTIGPGGYSLTELHIRQDVWAVISQGRIVITTHQGLDGEEVSRCTVYLPARFADWWQDEDHRYLCWGTIIDAARAAFGWRGDDRQLESAIGVLPILDIPDELVDFVAQNTDRPRPRRYNTTAVQLFERDGIAWLTAFEVKLYDLLKESGWLFVTQPPFSWMARLMARPVPGRLQRIDGARPGVAWRHSIAPRPSLTSG